MSQTALAFLLVVLAGCTLAIFVRPIYGLYTYIAVFYLHPPSRWWGTDLPDLRWSLLVALVTLFAIFVNRSQSVHGERWTQSALIRIVILYTLWMWLQVPWVVSTMHLDGVILYTKYVLLLYLMYTLIEDDDDFAGFCFAHALGCAYLGWLVYLEPGAGRLESVGGPGINNANTLSMHLSTGLIVAGLMTIASKGWTRYAYAIMAPFILNGIIQTETRGALVGLFLAGLATTYLKPKRIRGAYYALGVLGIIAFISLANEAFIARMTTMNAAVSETQQWDNSATSRIEIAKGQLQMFLDYPLGAGHHGTAHLSREYLDPRWLDPTVGRRASHNTIMSVLVDQGVFGIALLLVLIVKSLKTLRKLKGQDNCGLPPNFGVYRAIVGGSLVVVLGAGMFAQFLRAEVLIWSLGLLAILWRMSNAPPPSAKGSEA